MRTIGRTGHMHDRMHDRPGQEGCHCRRTRHCLHIHHFHRTLIYNK